MQKKLHKILLFCLASVILLLGVLFHENASSFVSGEPRGDNILKVHYLDVGQGDAIFIQTPYEQNILIDGGPDAQVVYELGKVMPFYDRTIDIMILTHPHSDHVSGLIDVLEKYDVKKIYYSGALHTAPDYISWLEIIREKNIPIKIVKEQFEVALGNDLALKFLYPVTDLTNIRAVNLNNTSIVNKLIYKDVSFLFTGDAEQETEKELMENQADLKSDILKVGHHGSYTASSQDLLDKIDPDIAVIMCGEDNSFGHPHMRILKRFERMGIRVYRNDLDGRITIESDGYSYWVE